MVKTLSSGNTAKLRLFQAGTETGRVHFWMAHVSAGQKRVWSASDVEIYDPG